MKKIKIGIIGLGNRGVLYANCFSEIKECEIVAIVDFKINEQIKLIPDIKVPHLYNNTDDFFNDNLDLDLLVISSMDKYHYDNSIKAIERNYNLLLEKPIACKYQEVLDIEKRANEKNLKVVVCHVLRYTKFYKEVKRIIDSKELGEIININATENVAYWHQLHSYVRGNWHNTKETAPMILTKSSHDMDIIRWLMGEEVRKVSSFGYLNFFNKEHKPEDSSNRCFECKLKDECEYNAYKFYLNNREWLIPFIGKDLSDENIDKYLRVSNFGRCAFDMDNDAVDHQVVNILFDNNKTASFTMNAYSRWCYRDIKVFGTKGDLVGNFETRKIDVNLFNGKSYTIDINNLTDDFSGHGGGDRIMTRELIDYLLTGNTTKSLTLLKDSIISHKMSFLSEESRLEEGAVKDVR